jgi:[ribosomal protein S5]-alanine N-acetyltransferase
MANRKAVATGFDALRIRMEDTPIRTERLILRLPRVTDARNVFYSYATDTEAIRFLSFLPHDNIKTTEAVLGRWINNWKSGNGELTFVIERKSDKALLGVVGMHDGHGVSVGYVLQRGAWGKGYMSEALKRIVDLAFKYYDAHRVWATCHPDNKASRRVLEKAGMTHEGTLRNWTVRPLISPKPGDSECLSITRNEWFRLNGEETTANTLANEHTG